MSDPTSAAKTGAQAAESAHVASDDVTVVEAGSATGTADESTESAWVKARKKLTETSSSVGSKVTDLKDRTMAKAAEATASDDETPSANVPGTAGASASGAAVTRRTRKARLRLSRLDPWSVMKTMLMFSVAGGIIFFVATWVVWGVINSSGVFESVNEAVTQIVASPGSDTAFRLEDYVNTHKVLGFAALISALNVVLLTALATLFSFLYNLAATVIGGLEVTLAED
ncbi:MULTISPECIES: DUF3566 domain-containing protein [unclassified Luteococcus]|uniref:DUF3566 domain-containing protein n=1 Tax=unclassified Luteococcus TaxID=2639923 RepID=UPI00313AEFF6